jgi:hypothetical protein
MHRSITMALGSLLTLLAAALVGSAQHRPAYHGVYHQPYYQYQQTDSIYILPIAPDYYYSTGDDSKEEILEELRQLRRLLKPAELATPSVPQPRLDRSSFRLLGRSGVDLDARVLRIVNRDCIGCHKPGAVRPWPLLTADRQLFRDADPQKEVRRRQRVYDSVESGDMPKDRPALSPSDKSALKQWADALK